jgi:hypothetical protein
MKNNKKLLKIRVLVYKIVFYILQAYRKFKQIKNFTIILKELYWKKKLLKKLWIKTIIIIIYNYNYRVELYVKVLGNQEILNLFAIKIKLIHKLIRKRIF